MMTKLQNPLVVAVLASVMSALLGVTLVWRAAGPMIAASLIKPAVKELPLIQKERGWDFWTIEIENLSTELKEEKARQAKKSELLDRREARVVAEETELAKVRADIEMLRKEVGTKVVEISSDESKNIRTLAQAYTILTPKAAVAIIRELDDATVVKILSVMKPEVVAAIFEEMSSAAGADGPLAKRVAMLSEKIRVMRSTKTAGAS